MGASKALAEWAVEAGRRALSRHALRDRALRQRARLVGLGGADLPPPDRRRRPGDGHRPAHDALLHDDPGGGAARHPRRLARRAAARCSCSRWASRSRSSSWPTTMIRALGPASPSATSRSRSSARRPGEKLHEELFNPYERPQPTPAPTRSCAPTRPRSTRAWVEEMFDEIGLLVLEGDAAGLAADGRRARERPAGAREPRSDHVPAAEDPTAADRLDSAAPLHASVLLAFSLQDQVEKYGAYVGHRRRSSAWPFSRCSTSPRRARSSACANGRAARPSARAELEERAIAQAEAARRQPPRPVPRPGAAARRRRHRGRRRARAP